MNLYTIGFSQKSAEEFFKILKSHNIKRLVDVRLNNKSQLTGFTNVKHFPYFLKIHHIEYRHKPDLAPTKELLSGYRKNLISWQDYEIKYEKILLKRRIIENIDWSFFDNAVLLCSEPKAERCHRRLLAEYLAERNKKIKKIIHL